MRDNPKDLKWARRIQAILASNLKERTAEEILDHAEATAPKLHMSARVLMRRAVKHPDEFMKYFLNPQSGPLAQAEKVLRELR